MPRHIDFTSSNGSTRIEAFHWPCAKPRGVVQLSHGMCEHMGRYSEFAEFLNAHGFAVVGNNHLGHGASLIDGQLGYFSGDGAYNNLVEDLELVRRRAAQLYPGLPHALFGHSMGSFIARIYAARYGSNLSCAIFCGTSGPNPLTAPGIALARAVCALRGPKHVSHMLERIASAGNLKRIPDARTPADWLTRDSARVDAFVADPLCGFTFTCSAYRELGMMLDNVSDEAWYASVPSALPMLLISGDADPIGKWGAGVRSVRDGLVRAGARDVELKLYPGARHELINELNRDEVFGDVLAFLDAHMQGRVY